MQSEFEPSLNYKSERPCLKTPKKPQTKPTNQTNKQKRVKAGGWDRKKKRVKAGLFGGPLGRNLTLGHDKEVSSGRNLNLRVEQKWWASGKNRILDLDKEVGSDILVILTSP